MKKIATLLTTLALLSACKKDSENTPSKTDLITAKNWRVTASTETITRSGTASSTTTDQYAAMRACEKDNFYKFNTNKTLIADEGATRCSTTDPQTTTLTWDFNSDQSKLLVTTPGSSAVDSNDIVELSATTLRLRETDTYTTGGVTVTTVDDVTFTAF